MTAIGEAFFNGYKDVFLSRFIDGVRTIELPKYDHMFPSPLVESIKVDFSDLELEHVKFSSDGTTIRISEESPQVRGKI